MSRINTQFWLFAAREDLRMARTALRSKLHQHCVFHCQQALEKWLKALWMEGSWEDASSKATAHHTYACPSCGYGEPAVAPPRQHDLVRLAERARLSLSSQDVSLLEELSSLYQASRYPDAKGFGSCRSGRVAKDLLAKTEALIASLKKQVPVYEPV